ncbi:hypothetical protein [Actinacidiphila glaucinigra]|uniref:hypothetical protein n=1 Tax=Actinacidiphila glaucinigra TaxID=235986 RepID=UPI0035DDB209
MTISYVGSGATSSHGDTVTPAYGSTPAAGQLGILQVVSGHPSDSIPSTPSGWALVDSFSGGGGAFGAGAGPRRITFFARVMAGGDAAPTVKIPAATGSVIAGTIALLSRSAGTGWRWVSGFGEDTSSGTGFSTAASAAPTWAPGDFAFIGYGLPLSTVTFSAQGITASGITFGAVTANRHTTAVATGNGLRTAAATVAVSSGTATAIPTLTATLSAANTGVAGVIRIREASSSLSATAQTAFPPRTLVAATGLLNDDIDAVTLYRVVGNTRTPVRAASGLDAIGQNAVLRVDAEQPFGIPVSYVAELTDFNGLVWTLTSGSITSTVASDVISDAVQGIGAAVTIVSFPEKKRDRNATTFNVGGRAVIVGRARSSASATVTVRTQTQSAGDDLQAVLQGATEGVILMRARTTLPDVDGYLAGLSDSEDPNYYNPIKRWALDVVVTEAWPDILEAAGFTLADIASNFSTLSDLAVFFTPGTLLSIALYDYGL